MDRAQVYTVDNLLPRDDNQADDQPGEVLKAFRSFILEFRLDNNFIYRYVAFCTYFLQLSNWTCTDGNPTVMLYGQTSSSNCTCSKSISPI